jgi:hypothetical protein
MAREFYSATHLTALVELTRDEVLDRLSVWLEAAIDSAFEDCSAGDNPTQEERREQEQFIGRLARSQYVVKVESAGRTGGTLVDGHPDEEVAYSDLYEMSASGFSVGGTIFLCKTTGEPFSRRDSRTTFLGMQKEFRENARDDGEDEEWMFERLEDSDDHRVIQVMVAQR